MNSPDYIKLKEQLEQIYLVYTKGFEAYSFNKYLIKPSSEQEENYLRNSKIFRMIGVSMFKLSVLELHKLVSNKKNDQLNLYDFSKILKREDMKKYSSDLILMEKFEVLDSYQHLTQKLKILRDKHYAHTDIIRPDPELTYDDLDTLYDLVFTIIEQIYIVYFECQIKRLSVVFDPDRFEMIKILAREKDRNLAERFKKFSNR
ncbi:AbiU2 domain-containing protein [Pareuzebyella sediminis]|uniref:AbiU2 domain-containing protein n=1 Tax=Pareuzebyella sediminis TaxID=2607998 RepID=UPI0011EDE872|nr:hypothetical protein [Pareuzebyella sediminis]